MNYEKIRLQSAKFVTLTSLDEIEFDYILPDFEKEFKADLPKNYSKNDKIKQIQMAR